MNRKNFLLNGTFSAFSLSAIGQVKSNENGTFSGGCETTNDILGPFYRNDAPLRQDLTFSGLKGNHISIQGRVLESDCTTPIENALVEIWHCDTEGTYDNESENFLHRASWRSGKEGEYSFKTIIPGKYLNGQLYRPSHIHFRVSAKGTKELISQIYFKGDPNIAEDPWASQEMAQHRILEISPGDIQSNLTINFDISLASD
ncbi:MAG: catechol 1,2-dioxygenase [Patiriisocius sp.]|jgi:catechol 1,2-dioxygenase